MKYYKLCVIGFFMLSALHLSAQVTVGAVVEPEEAALLDIKSINTRFDGGPTTDKYGGGLLLPRVSLTDRNDLSPFIDKNSMTAKLKKIYTGMIVYNLAESAGFSQGLYVWNGTQWDNISEINNTDWHVKGNSGTNPAVNFIGTKDRKRLSIRTNKIERIGISETGNIGINKADPDKALDINLITKFNSPLYLKGIPVASHANDTPYALLQRDTITGQIYSSLGMEGNRTKPYSFLRYKLSNLDLVNGGIECIVDTQIPTDEYVVIIIGSEYKPYTNQYGYTAGFLSKNEDGTFNPKTVYAAKNNGTWHLFANYPGGKTSVPSVSGIWELYCLAVNISVVKEFPEQKHDMQKSRFGQAPKIDGL